MTTPTPIRALPAGARLYTKRQVAEWWQLSVSTINRAMRNGEIEFWCRGRSVRFTERQIEAFMRRHTRRNAG